MLIKVMFVIVVEVFLSNVCLLSVNVVLLGVCDFWLLFLEFLFIDVFVFVGFVFCCWFGLIVVVKVVRVFVVELYC